MISTLKKSLRGIAALLCVILLAAPIFSSCESSEKNSGELSPALNTIAKESFMAKSALKGQSISFEASDFARATNLSSIDSITITKLPPVSDGELRVGSSVLTSPQTLSASSVRLLSYSPKSSVAVSEFYFTVNDSPSELCCKLYSLDEKNYAPTLSNASSNALEVMTFENISLFGTLPCYDPDGDITYVEVVSQPKNGLVVLDDARTGAYHFIPDEDFKGKDSFVYVARDIYGNYSPSASVSLSVKESSLSTVYVDLVDSRYHNAAIAMTEQGIMSGTKIGSASYFYPDRELSRAEFTAMAMNAAGINDLTDSGAKTVFADDAEIDASFKPYVAAAYELGYIKWLLPALGFAVGGIFVLFSDKLLDRVLRNIKSVDDTTSLKRSIRLISAITIHNIPEGMAIGVAFGGIASGIPGMTLIGAIMLAVGIGIQNFPEGAAVALPLRNDGFSRVKSFMFGQASALVEPLAAILGVVLVLSIRSILPFMLSFAAGAMIVVVARELIPESIKENKNFATFGLICGFIVMMILDVALS